MRLICSVGRGYAGHLISELTLGKNSQPLAPKDVPLFEYTHNVSDPSLATRKGLALGIEIEGKSWRGLGWLEEERGKKCGKGRVCICEFCLKELFWTVLLAGTVRALHSAALTGQRHLGDTS